MPPPPRSAPAKPVKFVDAAAPIRAADGSLRGVLALHMSWQWAAEVRDALLKPRGANSSLQLMVYGADGSLLLAPAGGGVDPPTLPTATLAALEEHWNTERWSDGIEAISASAESRSERRVSRLRLARRRARSASGVGRRHRRAAARRLALEHGDRRRLRARRLVAARLDGSPVDRLVRSLAHTNTNTETAPALLAATITRPGNGPVSVVRSQRRNDVQRITAAVARLQNTLKDCELVVKTLEERAHHDALTGLLNRAYLGDADRAPRTASRAARTRRTGDGVLRAVPRPR